ncbi:tubulin tyrosine ligase TtlE [Volvox carteri f. nagariensis]|uniref:Tubulin--tyrosine ligase-like protein 5 n=1 Tax=Volvox carteri f. nagariensis TaxID=3068 RepID=D8UCG7_VOLCA|nr:tubulin tyrosine ligase TtlE [Volvox carteri f. nagariensis]EFJ42490.1 tubulin tyrosine ligase TtlE [Volvox carteri f. nagariensis]|eukprot:XP_002956346.1 tubulin tyrosine ligase TtlE [Volvox carteri f. nagariensis]
MNNISFRVAKDPKLPGLHLLAAPEVLAVGALDISVRVISKTDSTMPSKRQKLEHEGVGVGAGAAMPRHPLSAVGSPIPSEGQEVWCIKQLRGIRIGGYPKSAPIPGPLGWQRPGDWDFLWAPARLALKAIPHLKPGQLVSACPGLMSITKKASCCRSGKGLARLTTGGMGRVTPTIGIAQYGWRGNRRLPATLKEALGESLAWDIVPHSFSLPEELPKLAAHAVTAATAPATATTVIAATSAAAAAHGVAATGPAVEERTAGAVAATATDVATEATAAVAPTEAAAAGASSAVASRTGELWILKTAQHLGKGLKLVPLDAAALEASRPRRRPSQKPYVLAQRYVDRPLLVDGRKFGIRVWVAVTGFNPLRAYLHSNGLVLFSTHGYDNNSWRTEAGDVALGHITNYAQNMDGTVWSLQQLEAHLGTEKYGKMWRLVQRNSALVIAAALKHIKSDHEALKCPSGMTCEVVGLDYLVDDQLHPWLLEVNGTPSLQVEHEDPRVEQLIHDQKYGMVQDLMSLLGMRERFKPRYAAIRAAAKTKQQAAAAAAAAALASDGGGGGHAAAAAKAAAAAAKPSASFTRKIREQLQPSTDSAVMARVAQELTHRGGFEPLMPLMPLDPQLGVSVPWDDRDFELRRAMVSSGEWCNGVATEAGLDGGADDRDGAGPAGVGAGAWRHKAGRDGGVVAADGVCDTEGDDDDEDDDDGGGLGSGLRQAMPHSSSAQTGRQLAGVEEGVRTDLGAGAEPNGAQTANASGSVVSKLALHTKTPAQRARYRGTCTA